MYGTSERNRQLTLIYNRVYKQDLQKARIIRKEMANRCRQNYEFPVYGVIFGLCPIFIAIIVTLFFN